MRRPSPALVVAVIALIVAMSGTSYAVAQLPRNSVGAKQLKAGAVTSQKVKDGAIAFVDLSAAARLGVSSSAYAAAVGPFTPQSAPALLTDAGAEVAATTISTRAPARLVVTAQVGISASLIFTSADRDYFVACWATIAGVQQDRASTTTIRIVSPSTEAAATIPVVAAAEVEKGQHAVGLRCTQGSPDQNHVGLGNVQMAVVATPR